MSTIGDVMFHLFVVMGGLMILAWIADRPRRRDRREIEAWWHEYREHERMTKLRHAWLAGIRRMPDESEDALIARFDCWLLRDDGDAQ